MVVCLACLSTAPAFAHHSFAAYDRTTSRTITGTVKEYEWANPHVRLVLVVTEQGGASRDWSFESGSTSHMASVGFSRITAGEGETISVTYHPRRSGPGGGYFIAIEKPNGRTYGPILAR